MLSQLRTWFSFVCVWALMWCYNIICYSITCSCLLSLYIYMILMCIIGNLMWSLRLQQWFRCWDYIYGWHVQTSMISEQEIKNWWEHKIANYLQNYSRRNRLTIAQEKEKFFTKTHEKFVELMPQLLKNILDEKSRSN